MLDPRFYATFSALLSMMDEEPIFDNFPYAQLSCLAGALLSFLESCPQTSADEDFQFYYESLVRFIQVWIGDRYTFKFDVDIQIHTI